MKINKIFNSHTNDKNAINNWTITHFSFWVVIGLYYKHKYLQIFILSILWELFEIYFYGINHETMVNRIIDIIFNMFGYYIGSQLPIKMYNSVIIITMWLISWIISMKTSNNINKSFYNII